MSTNNSNTLTSPPPAKSSIIESIDPATTRQSVVEYYGTTLQSTADLQTNSCCTGKAPPKYIRELLKNVADEIKAKYYGCGLCLPNYDLTGARVLDLGCGAGRDIYLASQLVGPEGSVVGVDMTEELLQFAKDYQDYHGEKFGFTNTEFYVGYLETLKDVPELKDNSFDLIISNCVINLCTDKAAVLKACYDLLKPGGMMYFSDVYTNRRVPVSLQKDALLWGECLSGALYWNDFIRIATEAGFVDPRLVEDSPITVQNKSVTDMIERQGHGGLEFCSATYCLFKVKGLDSTFEDYGQAVIYKGTIPRAESSWTLDKHHTMETGRVNPVCGNTYRMLHENARLAPHFDFVGSWDRHYGPFNAECGGGSPFDKSEGKERDSGAASCKTGSKGGDGGVSSSCCVSAK